MIRKLLEGFMFGVGLSLALVLAAAFVMAYFLPVPFDSSELPSSIFEGQPLSSAPASEAVSFHELPLEEQIKQASVIALARYEPSPDGKMKAVIREFLKKDPAAVIHYEIGDEFPNSSYYPREGRGLGEGVIVFFVGSPASMRLSVAYSGDRIGGLADIPIELFRKKCEAPDA